MVVPARAHCACVRIKWQWRTDKPFNQIGLAANLPFSHSSLAVTFYGNVCWNKNQTHLTTTCSANRFLDWKEMSLYYLWKKKWGKREENEDFGKEPPQWESFIKYPHTAVLRLPGTDLQHLSPVQSQTATHRSGNYTSSTNSPPFPNATKQKQHWSLKFCSVFCTISIQSAPKWADPQNSCTARAVAVGPPWQQSVPYCSWASVTWCLNA